MRYIRQIVTAAAFMLITAAAGAQTVTVAKSGTPTYSTIQEAINSFWQDRDPQPNIIQIIDSSVYEEVLDVNALVTIEGTASNRPVIAVKAHPDTFSDGINVSNPRVTTGSTILRNLIIIPSLTAPPNDAVRAGGTYLHFEMDNVLITANNGRNAPVSVDGLSLADTTGAVSFGDDGLHTTGGQDFSLVLKDTIITHMLGDVTAFQDGMELGTNQTNTFKVLDGCVFSFCKRMGIYASGAFEIDAPTTKCLIINNGGFAGLWWGDSWIGNRRINGVIVANNGGFGIEHQNGDASGLTLSNAILANNANDNLRVSEVRTYADIRLTSVTIGGTTNPAASAINIVSASRANIFLIDCIIAGNGSTHTNNTILHNGTGTLYFDGTALVTAGPFAMTTATGGIGSVSGTPTTTTDPKFVNTTDVTSPDYFDVANLAYSTANSADGPLGGGADFVGSSSVRDWSLY